MLWLNKFLRFLCGISFAVFITAFRETLSVWTGAPKVCYNMTDKRVCYFQAEEMDTLKNWNDAWKTCKENNSTLPTVENAEYHQHLESYLSTQLGEYKIWLAGRKMSSSKWQWKNRKNLSRQEFVSITGNAVYDTQAVINYKSGNSFFYSAEYPSRHSKHYYICYVDNMCCNHTAASVNYGKGYLIVHSEEQLDFFRARNKCFEEGGDLTTFEHDETLTTIRSKLTLERKYWIGLRRNWWIWNTTDSETEMVHSNWKDYMNQQSMDCVSIVRNRWFEETCNKMERFICQTVEREKGVIKPNSESANGEGGFLEYLLIGAVVGVLVIVLVIVILIIVLRRQKRRINDSKATRQQTRSRSEAQLTTYDALSKTNETNEMVGIYDEISLTTNEVKKPNDLQSNAIYAEVQETEGNNRKSKIPPTEPSQTCVTYATLEFEGNQ